MSSNRPMRAKPRQATVRRRDALIPADPYVIEAFSDVCLARRVHQYRRSGQTSDTDKLEAEAWKCLLHYLLTLERLPVRS